jgi:hypothetical protein
VGQQWAGRGELLADAARQRQPLWIASVSRLILTGKARLLIIAVALVGRIARSDAGEFQASVEVVPTLAGVVDPVTAERLAWPLVGGLRLSAVYGLDHQFHLGLAVHVGGAPDVHFAGVAFPLPDGSRPGGDLFTNLLAAGAGILGHFRLDTGEPWAPFARVELGGSYCQFSGIAHYPSGTGLRLGQEARTELAPSGRAALGLEYRFGNRILGSLAIAVQGNMGARWAWQFELPITVAYVWW